MALSRYLLSVDRADMQWAGDLVRSHEFGLEIVDFSRSSVLDDEFDEAIAGWKKILRDLPAGIALTLHGPFFDLYPFSRDKKVAAVAKDRYMRALEAAVSLGARGVIFHSGYLPCVTNVDYPEIWIERNAVFWRAILEQFPQTAVFLENMWDPVPDHLSTLCTLLKSSRFGVCFDIGHAHAYSKVSIEKWLAHLSLHLKHVHANDNNGGHDEELPLGEGSVDFSPLKGVLSVGSSIGVTLEVPGREASLKSFEALRNIGL